MDGCCFSYSAAYGGISYNFKGYCTNASRKTDKICYNIYR